MLFFREDTNKNEPEGALPGRGPPVADDRQRELAEASRAMFGERLGEAGHGDISTEIADAGPFYYAEDYHQQYLAKNPNGYCGLGGTGVSCPVGLATS